MGILILLLILLILVVVVCVGGSSGGSGSRLMTFPDGDRDVDLIDQVYIPKGDYQEVPPNPPGDPVDCGEWGTAVPTSVKKD